MQVVNKLRYGSLIISAVIGAFVGVAASAQTFECDTGAGASQGGYVSDKYFFDYSKDKAEILVVDALIYHENKGPIPAKLSGDSDKKLAFSWSVNLVNSSGQHARLLYRAAYYKADQRFTVSASVGGGEYVGSWDARGSCKVKK